MISNFLERILLRFLSWSVHRLGLNTLSALALLLSALGSVTLAIGELSRGLATNQLLAWVVIGLAVGWWLARSPWPGWRAGLATVLLGWGAFIGQAGDLAGTLLTLVRTLAWLAWVLMTWRLGELPDTAPFLWSLSELGSSMYTLLAQAWNRLLALASGQAFDDPTVATLAWGLGLWVLATWASWAVRRRNQPLLATAPAGILLVAILSYAQGSTIALLPVLGSSLLLMALVGHRVREQGWQTSGADFSLELRFDIAVSTSLATAGLVIGAALLSQFSIHDLVNRLAGDQIGPTEQMAGTSGLSVQPVREDPLEGLRTPGLPRQHLLGSGTELSERVVMVVDLDEEVSATYSPRYYWRSLTYDQYTGRGWATSHTQTSRYPAGASAHPDNPTTHRIVHHTVRALYDLGGLLYATGTLLTTDHDYRVVWRTETDAFGAMLGASIYQVDSQVPIVSTAALRAAGDDYPGWIRTRYLALPDSVPPRVLALAQELSAGASTPFEIAQAIERYLRTFPYTLDLPTSPPGRDVVDYFLFDLQKGYCDYYATSMVVLARAAGLPARLVIGYYSGLYDADKKRYIVAETDAHSWAEVYFPEYGWIEFEPTAGRPALERPETAAELPVPEWDLPPSLSDILRRFESNWLVWLAVPMGLVLLGLGFAGWMALDNWWLDRLSPAASVASLYHRLYRYGRRLRAPTQSGDTPREFASALKLRVKNLDPATHHKVAEPREASDILWLTNQYTQAVYSPHPPTAAAQKQAIRVWKRLQRRLWLAWFRQQIMKMRSW